MENLRKRTTKEAADSKLYGVTGFARDVVDIADNLQRALDAVPAEARAAADPGLIALMEGVELTSVRCSTRWKSTGLACRCRGRSGNRLRIRAPEADSRSAAQQPR
ncbi:molecular chaperone GrpE (heat shock protein) [Bradyrhizobium sp. USDA 3397]